MTDEVEALPGSQLSDEDKINLGQMASQAFNNPVFVIWYNMEMQRTIDRIDAAPPEHTKEVMWQKCKRDVLAEMKKDFTAMVQQADRVYKELQARNDPERKAQAELDTQGFGLNFGQGGAS